MGLAVFVDHEVHWTIEVSMLLVSPWMMLLGFFMVLTGVRPFRLFALRLSLVYALLGAFVRFLTMLEVHLVLNFFVNRWANNCGLFLGGSTDPRLIIFSFVLFIKCLFSDVRNELLDSFLLERQAFLLRDVIGSDTGAVFGVIFDQLLEHLHYDTSLVLLVLHKVRVVGHSSSSNIRFCLLDIRTAAS